MHPAESIDPALNARLVDNLYVEAMVMADEARSYFDGAGMEERDRLDIMARLSFACESLKVTTRLMHVIAWLLTQKALRRGEIEAAALERDQYQLGEAAPTSLDISEAMPARARALVEGSQSLYDRVLRLQDHVMAARDVAQDSRRAENGPGPARALLDRLENSF